ncbi:protein of unknown function [Magnetospirillum gryphiswaldense MSR-1 v2]|uniref:Uncharacterized protein n=1 Tax=Magnetospirillum gryphiswaldense (strain DSM 6361 / JCM 21280 / NBRC 15271 / MSR-1) TaxID=431944 RepID=V6F0H4_MAGGM|nr:hypothetical protein [Magnetospirillum gryphiswaldense]CDK98887.1 protein of unknown function [Magnetospirillum gryphiswaldense MSR-1 v2]
MALVKKNQISGQVAIKADEDGAVASGSKLLAEAQKRKARTFARQQKAAERIAAATSQLASGIAESASAAEELRKASEQIAQGAEEAAGAAQESQKAVDHGAGLIRNPRPPLPRSSGRRNCRIPMPPMRLPRPRSPPSG